eukprot:jgi/Psemu1/183321/e_gw1.31.79.1
MVQGFAAKNKRKGGGKSGKGNKGGASFGGFGKAPPTLDEVLAKIRINRVPEDADTMPCPCGSSTTEGTGAKPKTFSECCGPLLGDTSEEANETGGCQTPIQVLQSRYTSFCYRNIRHVIRTTHEKCRDYREDKVAWAKDLDKEGMFDSFEFVGLEILGDKTVEDENEAFMDFTVRLRGRSLEDSPVRSRSVSSIEGEETVISERSRFLRDPETGTWKYAGGDVRSAVEGLEDTTLNV